MFININSFNDTHLFQINLCSICFSIDVEQEIELVTMTGRQILRKKI